MKCRKMFRVTMREIQLFVCSEFDVPHAVLLSGLKTREVAIPRQLAMVLCRRLTSKTLGQIGEVFHRDHTTVGYAIRKWDGSPRLIDLVREFKVHKRELKMGVTFEDVLKKRQQARARYTASEKGQAALRRALDKRKNKPKVSSESKLSAEERFMQGVWYGNDPRR